MKDLFSKKQTRVFVALPRQGVAGNTRLKKNEAPRRVGGKATLTKKNTVATQTVLPFAEPRRPPRRQAGESSRIRRVFKAASRGEIAVLFLVILLLTVISFGKIYLETEVKTQQAAVRKGHAKMDDVLLKYEALIKSVTKKKDLGEIEEWARTRGMVKPDPDKIILVK